MSQGGARDRIAAVGLPGEQVVFYAVFWTALILLAAPLRLLGGYYREQHLEKWFQVVVVNYWVAVSAVIAGGIANGLCRRRGMALDLPVTIERITRVEGRLREGGSDSAAAPFLVPRGVSAWVGPLCFTFLASFHGWGFWRLYAKGLLLHILQKDPIGAPLFLLTFAVATVLAIASWRNIRKPEVQADARGISYCEPFGVLNRHVRWEQVAYCDVVTPRNLLGVVHRQRLVLRDLRGTRLMTIRLAVGSASQNAERTSQLIRLVRQQLTGV